jgi:diaminopimelate epimerase
LPNLVVEFTKMHGAANDFVVVDNRFFRFSEAALQALARQLCPRRTGIGADGLLALDDAAGEAHAFRMHYHNADGSRATMCGNGARCLARYARSAGFDRDTLVFATDAGAVRADVPADPLAPVTLHLAPPRAFEAARALADGVAGLPPVAYVHTGTPHAVVFVDDAEAAPLARWGPRVRRDDAFRPEGVNLNVAQVLGPATLRVRTFEKGVEAETQACGTGVLAAAVAARRLGHLDAGDASAGEGGTGAGDAPPVTVVTRGGTFTVGGAHASGALREDDGAGLTLAGPVATVFRGTFEWDG